MFAGWRATPTKSPDRTITRRAVPALAAFLAVLTFGLAEAATHYPPNAKCGDCHAVSKAAMVVGTKLIKASQATVDLGITEGTPQIKCLFCHREGAVSNPTAGQMMAVWDHFNAQSASKHPADQLSGFVADGGKFDCLDCHTNLGGGVLSDSAGNATIHGVDALNTNKNVYQTLIGSLPAAPTQAQISSNTCSASACHGITTTRQVYGVYTANPKHNYATMKVTGLTTNGGVPTDCTSQCHGTHNSYDNGGLVVLRADGTSFNLNTTYASPAVTPEKCGNCHAEDDADAVHGYNTKGHGKSGISLQCTNCHDPNLPHKFDYSGANPMRFSLTVNNSATSGIRQAPQYSSAYSICLTCHASMANKVHGTTVVAGCNDCHEPHGMGSPIGTLGPNDKMIRSRIEKIGTNGQPIYGFNTTVGTWEPVIFTMNPTTTTWDTYRPDNNGLCDSRECHEGRGLGINSTAIWPLTSFLVGTGHSGGPITITTTFNCVGCHNHTDSSGGFGALDSCTACHGAPPPTAAHLKHTGAPYTYACAYCHPGGGTLNHNESNLFGTAAYTTKWNANPEQIRGNVQVAFTDGALPVALRVGSYTLAQTTTARTSGIYGNCASTGCHGGSINAADHGTITTVAWHLPATAACGSCHYIMGTNKPGSSSHTLHVANGRNISCEYCHGGVTNNGTSGATLSSQHANGVNNVAPVVGTYNGLPLTLGYATPNCSNISCHGAYKTLAWGATAGVCENCHGTFLTTGGMTTTVSAKHPTSTWRIGSGFGVAHAIGTSNAGRCGLCHANTDTAYITTPGLDMHLDGKIQLSDQNTYTGTSGAGGPGGCAGCHVAISTYQMADSGYPFQVIAGSAGGGCTSCHGDGANNYSWPVGTTYPNRAGEHAQHIAAIARVMGWGTTANPAWNSSCNFCHPEPYTLGVHNLNQGTTGAWGTTADLYRDGVNTGASDYKRVDGAANGVVSSYSVATKTCSNVDCHYRQQTPVIGTGATAGWLNTANTIGCSGCHGYATAGSYTGTALPAAHPQHVGTGAGQKNYACNSCHPNWAAGLYTTGHQSNVVNVIVTGNLGTTPYSALYRLTTSGANLTTATVKYTAITTATAGGCFNLYCHPKSPSPVWAATIGTAGAGGCTDCHLTMQTSGNNPQSGLHYGVTTPSVTGRWHDDRISTTAKCGYCHTTLPAQATHVNGAFNAGLGQTAQMGLASFYVQTADNVGYCSGGTLGSTGCHDGTGDMGRWRRRWDRAIHYSPVVGTTATCAGCHGGYNGNDFTFGQISSTGDTLVEHYRDWDGDATPEVFPNHSNCSTCHAYPAGIYTNLGNWAAGVTTGAGFHGNNQIEMNASSGYTRTAIGTATPAYGCAQHCHGTNVNHGLESSGWTLQLVTGPAGGCTGCHSNGSTGYWPTGTGSATYPKRGGEHQQHVDAIALRVMNTTDDGVKNTTCNYCHPDQGGSYSVGVHDINTGAGALSTTATLYGDGGIETGFYKNMGGSAQAVLGTYNATTKVCFNTDCHYRNPSPQIGSGSTGGWYAITSNNSACNTCHLYVSATGAGVNGVGSLPNAHPQHVGTGAGQKNYACNYCHPNWGTTFNHQSNRVNVIVTGNLGTTAFSATYRIGTGAALTTTAVKYNVGTFGACNNLYCHPKTPSTAWNGTISGNDACTQCHDTTLATGLNPQSGLHFGTTPIVSQRRHDDTIATTSTKCAYCHVTLSAQATHVNGVFNEGVTTGDVARMGLASFYTQVANDRGYCSGGTLGSTGCHDGTGDAGFWRRRWDANIHYTAITTTVKTACLGCHGGFGTIANWPETWTVDPIGTHNATDGHVEHDYTWGTSVIRTNVPQIIGNHSGAAAEDRCSICHVWPDTPYVLTGATLWLTTNHGNNMIDMNSTMGYTRVGGGAALPAYGCATNCHTYINTSYGIEGSNWTLNNLAGPAMTCTSCHTGSGGGAKNVGATSSHTRRGTITSFATFNACTDCHPGGTKGATHSNLTGTTSVGVVGIPRSSLYAITTSVGINYGHTVYNSAIGTTTGFVLGGDATSGTTEAEICWNCHNNATYNNPVISEWGIGSHGNMNPSTPGYNYGSLTTTNWTVATWYSAVPIFTYKGGKVQSVHSANPITSTNAIEPVANIRCSYCHDVHGTRGDIVTTAPYLRGSYRTNPYLEDGAPQRGQIFTHQGSYGAVPRGSPRKPGTNGLSTYGGYQIDQNNFGLSSTQPYTAAEFGGLCEICHGNGDGTFSDTEISALNVFADGVNTWWTSTYNGHANSVKRAAAPAFVAAEQAGRNIFNQTIRMPGGASTTNSGGYTIIKANFGAVNVGTQSSSTYRYSFRDIDTPRFTPGISACYAPRGITSTGWLWPGAASGQLDVTTLFNAAYHDFTCSKCHNPHASRLPRLMISNCLDTRHNDWANSWVMLTMLSATTNPDNRYRKYPNVTNAQNCHRQGGAIGVSTAGTGKGWNHITPW